MYSDTITLFNRHKTPQGDFWYPTILTGVDLNADKAAIIAKYGEQSADNARLHIRYSLSNGAVMVGRKRYMPPKEWDSQEEIFPETLTFTSGNDFDFFMVGEWNENVVRDDDFLDGFYNYINTRFDFVYAITSVAQYSVIPHFEIMAK